MSKLIRSYGFVVLAMIFWSFSFIWFKQANETFRPITIVFIRLVIAVIILTAYIFFTSRNTRIKKSDRKFFLLLAVLEPFLYFIGESNGLTYVSATVGSVIISTIPVIAALGAWLIFRERLKKINYAGIIISFLGVVIFILNKDGSLSFSTKGLLLLNLAVLSAVGYNLTLTRLVENYSPVYIVFIQNVIGCILFLPVFLVVELHHLSGIHFVLKSFIPILELSFFASCGAFILFAWSVRNMGITRANVFTNFIPIFTALFSVLIFGEKLTLQNIIGMVIVIAGLLMSQLKGQGTDVDKALTLTGKTA